MTNLERALLIAEKAHANQSYDIYPYMYHLKMVLDIGQEMTHDEDLLIGCVLHDIMEDCDLSYNDIKKAFNTRVAEIVYCLTDELGRNRKERKAKTLPKIASNPDAVFVKICDRIANVSHSKSYNSDKFNMYKKENENFLSHMRIPNYTDHHLIVNAIDRLLEEFK